MIIGKFIKKKVTSLSALTILSTYIGVVVGLDYLYKTYWVGPTTEPIVWAASITLGLYAFVGLLNYCLFVQLTMQDEIDRITAVKAKLEGKVLKKRRSSK